MSNQKKKRKDNPTPFRLGEIKAPLQREAAELDRSLHWLVLRILSNYLKEKDSTNK